MQFERPLFEMKWSKMFNYPKGVMNMYEKCIAEFNYRLLHVILNTNLSVNQWNKNVSPLCEK